MDERGFNEALTDLQREVTNLQTPEDREAELQRRLTLANVPKNLRDVSLDMIPDNFAYKKRVAAWPMYYWRTSVREKELARGMFLFGPPASGKTALLAGTTAWLVRNRLPAYFFKASKLLDEARTPTILNPDSSDLTVFDYLTQVRVLCLDDIYRVGENRFGAMTLEIVENLLRDRWDAGLTTNLSANVTLDQLAQTHARLASVIEEQQVSVEVKGLNWRKLMAADEPF